MAENKWPARITKRYFIIIIVFSVCVSLFLQICLCVFVHSIQLWGIQFISVALSSPLPFFLFPFLFFYSILPFYISIFFFWLLLFLSFFLLLFLLLCFQSSPSSTSLFILSRSYATPLLRKLDTNSFIQFFSTLSLLYILILLHLIHVFFSVFFLFLFGCFFLFPFLGKRFLFRSLILSLFLIFVVRSRTLPLVFSFAHIIPFLSIPFFISLYTSFPLSVPSTFIPSVFVHIFIYLFSLPLPSSPPSLFPNLASLYPFRLSHCVPSPSPLPFSKSRFLK